MAESYQIHTPKTITQGPLFVYEQCVAAGELEPDSGQREMAAHLQKLYEAITAETAARKSLFAKRKDATKRSGAYIWGDVGRGKSVLMDMFFASLPMQEKHRIHFHAFMRDVHARIHAWRQLKSEHDVLPRVVKDMAQDYAVLCLDELQVHDITDAMILSRLFTLLFEQGVVVVITSNRAPGDLYQGGLQREQFEKFITLVHEKMDVLCLYSPHDYRLRQLKAMKQVYFSPLSDAANEALYDIYRTLTQGAESSPLTLTIQARALRIEKTACGVAWMTFAELCERPLGAGDYLEIAAIFHTLVLQDIPQLSPEKRNEAKRFVTLIDTLYDHKVKLICSAAVPPDALYPAGDGRFEFARTVSRLIEMQSEAYLGASHLSSVKV